MELQQLRYFVEICSRRSFSLAAKACYVSAQGISMAIQRLETELGQSLFIRSPKGIALTTAGNYLLPRAQQMVALSDECLNYFATHSTYSTTLPLVFAPGTIEEFAGPVVRAFRAAHPEVEIGIREYTDVECDNAIFNGEAEIGFTCGPVSDVQFHKVLCTRSRHALIVPSDHPLADRPSISAADLKGLPLAMLHKSTRTYSVVRSACRGFGFEPTVITFTDNILSVYDLVQIGHCLGISTMALAERLNRPGLTAVPFDSPELDWTVSLITRRGAALSPLAREFEAAVRSALDTEKNSW